MNRLLLISNSTMAGEGYLDWPKQYITDFLKKDISKVLFIPYAGIGLSDGGAESSYAVYEEKVKKVYAALGYDLSSIHREADATEAIKNAESIAVGGGNTFHLVGMLHKHGLIDPIRERVRSGAPYMGWSAGANIACPSLKTTNDMPIYEPESFATLNLIPFQINPHYLDANPDGHAGETREQRINEFLKVNPGLTVAGLREGCLLEIEGERMLLKGKHSLRIFRHGLEPKELNSGDILDFLMNA
ncbi:MAG: dipeptidase PepE [Bacteroidales bacterium]